MYDMIQPLREYHARARLQPPAVVRVFPQGDGACPRAKSRFPSGGEA